MVRKVEQRRVRGALDRFGPPLQGVGNVRNDGDGDSSARPQPALTVKRPYVKVSSGRGSSTISQVRSAAAG
ncbi:hypothetical protein MycrhN_2089 [Mycolicibacterium rhodesiae NBB3]|jgi:hypothetical protein|uniref:Uncharacterized protein n=1 Tax=Mycolicibacterium rhodesiae (strain NBB3) TaxID=710685 RepID=G8RQT6_MYCRN|nr:hypothetical protein MycrhN_2089 [Mycolicibacterium rhodesiae NBB3]